MPFTTPATVTAGTAATAAYANTFVRDNIAWMATDSPCCRAYHNANQPFGNATDGAVALNSERFDNSSMHSTSVNTSRITVPTGGGGKFLFGALIEFAGNVTGDRGNHIKLNGTTYIAKSVVPAPANAFSTTITSSYAMSAADYVENYAYQQSGGFLNLLATGNYSPEFWAYWLRT